MSKKKILVSRKIDVSVSSLSPTVPQTIRDAGATQLRGLVPAGDAGTLLAIYNHALTRTYFVAAVMAAVSIVGVVGN
jgi:hypothetical protein